MNKNNKTLFNPYVGVIIVFLLFSYFAYQGYLKDKIAEKVDGVTKTIHIQEQAKTYQDNLTSLTDIWINTNTIGSSLMTLALLITGFASSFGKWYMRLLSLPALILAGATIWVCQSKAALYALVIFVILEILPKKIFRNTHLSFWMYAAVSVLALPISYFAAMSDKVHLFTGREEIWRKFYETLGEKTGQIFVGMKPFFFHRGNQILGNHNTYHALVNHYGLIGFALSIILLLSFLWLLVRKCELTNGQLTFLWAFLAIMCQSFMEETLTTISWVPIVFLMLAMAKHQYKTTR